MFSYHADLCDARPIEPWQPRTLTKEEWPPNYRGVYAWRLQQLRKLRADPLMLKAAKAYYKTHPKEFILHWVDTFDPRKEHEKWMPFIFFEKQAEFVDFFFYCLKNKVNGVVEKCRDAGVTWLCCALSVTLYLFGDDVATGWGSRIEDLVDKIGDTSSIFEKMRKILERLPPEFLPEGFSFKDNLNYMRISHPSSSASIVGESGDNIGRGGRSTLYFVDESAHIARPEKIEAALGDNTNVQIHISSVNGYGNVFHRKRKAGIDWPATEKGRTSVFVFDWSDHPEKTREWYNARRKSAEDAGLLHVFAQEIERNYSAAVVNTIIPSLWIEAAIDAHLRCPAMLDGESAAALDVADEGADVNALASRKGFATTMMPAS